MPAGQMGVRGVSSEDSRAGGEVSPGAWAGLH